MLVILCDLLKIDIDLYDVCAVETYMYVQAVNWSSVAGCQA